MANNQDIISQTERLVEQGLYGDAVNLCAEALSADQKCSEALYGLGLVSFNLRQFDQSLEWVDAAISSNGLMAKAHVLRARSLRALGGFGEAFKSATIAAKSDPELPEAWHCLGFIKMSLGRWSEARDDLKKAVELKPDDALIRSQYALTLSENDETEAAFAEIQKALSQSPSSKEILMTKSTILASAGYYDLAEQIRVEIGAENIFSKAEVAFLGGEFSRGLKIIAERNEAKESDIKFLPKWNGEKDKSLHLLLAGEQGFGDIIQFIRYASFIKECVGKVSLRVPRLLARLVEDSMPELSVIVMEDEKIPSDIGARCGLMDAATYLKDGFDPQPGKVPYLRANSSLCGQWRERLAQIQGPRIGIVWAGNRRHTNDHKRSIPISALKLLTDAFGEHLVSMQLGAENKLENVAFDAAPFINNFADSAALINELDLLITIDSAPAHLAGAIGKPVWNMLPFSPDWRWLLGREDSIWYPTMRLFRQDSPGDWEGVISRICANLGKFISGDQTVLKPMRWEGGAFKRHPKAVTLQGS